jgi:hypothetical protein
MENVNNGKCINHAGTESKVSSKDDLFNVNLHTEKKNYTQETKIFNPIRSIKYWIDSTII